MKKIFLTILFLGMLIGFFARAVDSRAAGSCNCLIKVSGTGCNINATKSFPYGQKLTVAVLEGAIDWSQCSLGKSFASSYLNNYKQYEQTVTADLCNQIAAQNKKGVYDVSLAKYDYEFSCIAIGTDDSGGSAGGKATSGGTVGTAGTQGATGGSNNGDKPQWPDNVSQYLNRVSTPNINMLIGRVIGVIIGLIGSVALVMFAYAGIMWMVSMDGDKKAKASKTLMWSSLGLIVIMASYAMVTFVFNMIN